MTSTQQSTIIAVFSDASKAQAAAKDLQSIGVSRENMFIEASRGNASGSSSTGTGSYTDEPGTSMPAHGGGVGGWFKSLFGGEDEEDRGRYETSMGQGNVMLSVHARADQQEEIADVLERHSPIDVHGDNAATASSGAIPAVNQSRKTTGGAARNTTNQNTSNETIPVVEEELQVGKRNVLRGGVRVYSRVVERPVEESINLSEEHVHVERRPVDRAATEADFRNTKGSTIEVQEYAEEAVVGKSAHVVEEVYVGKETTQRSENIRDSVRHTEVNVEQIPGGQSGAGSRTDYDDTDFRSDFKTRYGSSGESYDTYAPSYRYGHEMASDPRYKGRSYSEVESQLRSDYERRNPGSTWEKMKDSVRYGWDKVTGNRSQSANR